MQIPSARGSAIGRRLPRRRVNGRSILNAPRRNRNLGLIVRHLQVRNNELRHLHHRVDGGSR
jgi:hypothetical protein